MPPKRKGDAIAHKYDVGNIVWAKYGPHLFSAKVLEQREENGKPQVLVHFLRWHQRHDNWLFEDDTLPDTEETRTHAAELLAEKPRTKSGQMQKKKIEKQQLQPNPAERNFPVVKVKKEKVAREPKQPRQKKLKMAPDAFEEGQAGERKLTVELPNTVKKWLIKDWDAVIRNRKVVQLPRKPSALQIFQHFMEEKTWDEATKKVLSDVINGLVLLFNRSFASSLIYPFEKPQYLEQVAENKKREPSEIYGVEHLTRLFVQLPTLLACTRMTDSEFAFLQAKIEVFLRWLSRNAKKYFGKPYKPTDRSYHDKVFS